MTRRMKAEGGKEVDALLEPLLNGHQPWGATVPADRYTMLGMAAFTDLYVIAARGGRGSAFRRQRCASVALAPMTLPQLAPATLGEYRASQLAGTERTSSPPQTI